MAMDKDILATAMKGSLGFGALTTTSQTTGLAQSIIDEIKAAFVNNLPGTVTGTAPSSGGPLTGGSSTGGVISGMVGESLAGRMVANMGLGATTAQITAMALAICTHVMTGTVAFSVITGACGNSPVSPGPLVGAGVNGLISGLDGSAMADLMKAAFGGTVSEQLLALCSAIVSHVQTNAKVTYAAATVTGTCPSGGGPVTLGAGLNGTIA